MAGSPMLPIDLEALARAGYAPCPYTGDDGADLCPGRAWADDASWIGPGLLWASYPASDCGHCAGSAFVLSLDAATLDAADELDRALYGGGAP